MGRRKKILTPEEQKAKELKEFEKKNGLRKRGRKPKNKIQENIEPINIKPKTLDTNIIYQNIILHLKCKKEDIKDINNDFMLQYNPTISDVKPYDDEDDNFFQISNNETKINNENIIINNNNNNNNEKEKENITEEDIKINDLKVIFNKLKELEHNLHFNNINKKSNCFWCTYDFDNPVIYIPKSIENNKYVVYGNFCSPECACSHLFNEQIDDSLKFERYQLLNYIYCEIYDYQKNIKLAPNPYYTLEKYMGNLTIQEYRKLLHNERLLILIDKPLTIIYPELHEDNNEFDVGFNNTYMMLKNKRKKSNKNDSINNIFNN